MRAFHFGLVSLVAGGLASAGYIPLAKSDHRRSAAAGQCVARTGSLVRADTNGLAASGTTTAVCEIKSDGYLPHEDLTRVSVFVGRVATASTTTPLRARVCVQNHGTSSFQCGAWLTPASATGNYQLQLGGSQLSPLAAQPSWRPYVEVNLRSGDIIRSFYFSD